MIPERSPMAIGLLFMSVGFAIVMAIPILGPRLLAAL